MTHGVDPELFRRFDTFVGAFLEETNADIKAMLTIAGFDVDDPVDVALAVGARAAVVMAGNSREAARERWQQYQARRADLGVLR